ncbi:MAG: site-2 protease family protein [Deltaproteobacteria bacterium]|nr:site-2 protease family protein [Deltaproteobacteria bacterium]
MVRPRYWLHAGLFLLTCMTTFQAGAAQFASDRAGVEFSATLLAILLTHEMGHYLMARKHGIPASLPYFIPLPMSMGTLGALIRMRAPMDRRDALIDVGAAGPLAGLAVAIPLLAWGLTQSPLIEPALVHPGEPAMIEGNSILYIILKLLTKGMYLPSGGLDVQLGPMAMAAWVGLLVTFINLMPIGQLDGGHVAFAYFGDRHEKGSRWLHRGLLLVGLVVLVMLAWEARAIGLRPGSSLAHGAMGAAPWFTWALLLLGMRRISGGQYHPPVGADPLTGSRRVLFWLMVAVFVLLFTPVPMREALAPPPGSVP